MAGPGGGLEALGSGPGVGGGKLRGLGPEAGPGGWLTRGRLLIRATWSLKSTSIVLGWFVKRTDVCRGSGEYKCRQREVLVN